MFCRRWWWWWNLIKNLTKPTKNDFNDSLSFSLLTQQDSNAFSTYYRNNNNKKLIINWVISWKNKINFFLLRHDSKYLYFKIFNLHFFSHIPALDYFTTQSFRRSSWRTEYKNPPLKQILISSILQSYLILWRHFFCWIFFN